MQAHWNSKGMIPTDKLKNILKQMVAAWIHDAPVRPSQRPDKGSVVKDRIFEFAKNHRSLHGKGNLWGKILER